MYTSYSIEKVASSNRAEALAAAEASRLARAVRRTAPAVPQHASPATGTIRVPRQRRWLDQLVRGPVPSGR